ncbi:unnamed protein product [Adineta ricciae]|uniref:Uncharacterized protein n=1 Tax=Adineta ricciae TaxID=249248 RepID=A0A816DF67_ADIRI|nr:unnamed protein product [Adineta ricciae]
MGCCEGLPTVASLIKFRRRTTSLTHADITQLQIIFAGIPEHSRQVILNLPARQLLSLYQYHMMALYHGLQKEWQSAIYCEQRVIKGLQALLPTDKDHYIFFNFYSVLSASFLALGALQKAIEVLHIALAILLKHTPTDYKTISVHYYHLANAYKALHDSRASAQYLTKAVEAARLRSDSSRTYAAVLETDL